MLLARQGCDVTLLEARATVGGRTGYIEEQGFRFDIGPTFFLYPQVLQEIFAEVGRDLMTEVPMTKIDPLYRVVFEGNGHLDARDGVEAMAAEIARLSPEDARNLPRYMSDNRRKIDQFRPILSNPFDSLLDFLRPNVLASLKTLRPQRSLDGDLQNFFSDERVRRAFSFQSKYLGMSPFNCPSLFTILAFLEHEYGVWHPTGGCNMLMRKMADLATEFGADIRLSEPVTGLEFEGKRASAVVTDQARYDGDAIILNADFAESAQKLIPQHMRRRWTDKKIQSQKFSCSTYMMYLGIRGDLPDIQHHTICLADDLVTNVDEIQTRLTLPANPSFYVQNASITDPTLAPEGHSALYVLVPVPNCHAGIDWPNVSAGYRELVLDRLSLIGIGDLRDRIVYEKVLTPHGWIDEHRIYKGATFNMSHDLSQMLYFRPHNRFEDVPGVYLVGGGTHPGSGLPVIFESARISSRLIARDLKL
ncbi:MAG: phytoene desaturase [Rhizobiales bacterium]|nr:phytoene desaturase [Hyphomicrobiales bacterium]